LTSTHSLSWVESLAWSSDGEYIGAAAGADVVVGRVLCQGACSDGDPTSTFYVEPSVRRCTLGGAAAYDIAFASSTAGIELAVGAYGGISIVTVVADKDSVGSAESRTLKIGAAAVLCLDVSPDGQRMAVGCLDQRVRIFYAAAGNGNDRLTTSGEWAGFDGPVKHVAWSLHHGGEWLAAAGGSALFVAHRDLPKGEPPTLCVMPSGFVRDGSGGTGCPRPAAFAAIAWCPPSPSPSPSSMAPRLLAAMDRRTGDVHLFDVSCADYAVPRRALALRTFSWAQTGIPSPVGGVLSLACAAEEDGDEEKGLLPSVILTCVGADRVYGVRVRLVDGHNPRAHSSSLGCSR
jgi:hypothetical protein